MRKTTLLFILLTLTGCHRSYWEPPAGADEQQTYRDQADCKQQAAMSAYGVVGYMRDHVYSDTFEMCMRGRGWDKVRKSKS